MMKQRTIASPVKTVGIGLHSGCKVTISIKPAPVNSGVQFVRVDTSEQSVVPATALAVCDTRLASVIKRMAYAFLQLSIYSQPVLALA